MEVEGGGDVGEEAGPLGPRVRDWEREGVGIERGGGGGGSYAVKALLMLVLGGLELEGSREKRRGWGR